MSDYRIGMSLPDIIKIGLKRGDTLGQCKKAAETQGYAVSESYINEQWLNDPTETAIIIQDGGGSVAPRNRSFVYLCYDCAQSIGLIGKHKVNLSGLNKCTMCNYSDSELTTVDRDAFLKSTNTEHTDGSQGN